GNANAQTTCSGALNTYNKNLRIIFMVDDSGSTFSTDPNFLYRRQSIQNFVAQYGLKPNFTYAFGEFGNDSASFYNIGTSGFSSSSQNVFGNSSDLDNALNVYVNSPDHGGSTPYISALNAINNIVANDVDLPGYETDYAVVFMSDGAPSDTSDPGNA